MNEAGSDNMTLGAKIREIRKKKGLSIVDLKAKTGLSKSTISDLENDKSSPTVSTLQKLATALKMDIREFFRNNNAVDNSDDLSYLLQEFPEGVYLLKRACKELSPYAKKQLVRIMEAFLGS